MKLEPSLTLFLGSLVFGLGFGLGFALMQWVVGKVTGLVER